MTDDRGKPPLVVFDLDGTLVDSVPDITAALNRMLAARGCPGLTDRDVAAMVGDGVAPLIDRVFRAVGAAPDDDAARDYLNDYEANVAVHTTLFAGMAETLAALRHGGYRLAVCTNKPARAATLLLDALGVATLFAAVGGGDSFGVRKPHPGHLAATVALAGSNVTRAVMVGDHSNDIGAATGCAMKAIFAAWGYGRTGMADGATAIAAQPADLPAIIGRLLN